MDTVFAVPWVARREVSEEAAWLAAARAGESWALERLYNSYQSPVYALCMRMLGSREDAVDATQMTFVRAFRQVGKFRGESTLKTWIYRIAVNEAITVIRKRREGCELEEGTALTDDGAPAVVEQLAVRAALAKMKPDARAILVLRFWEGLEYQEIADVLGVSMPAVKMRLHRAREEFRARYEDAR